MTTTEIILMAIEAILASILIFGLFKKYKRGIIVTRRIKNKNTNIVSYYLIVQLPEDTPEEVEVSEQVYNHYKDGDYFSILT